MDDHMHMPPASRLDYCCAKFNTLGLAAHEASARAGWWTDPATGQRRVRNRGEMLMLMVSELVEMHRAVRDGVRDEHLPSYPGALVEAADFVIRAGDFVSGFGGLLGAHMRPWLEPGVVVHEQGVVGAVCAVADAMEADRKGREQECFALIGRAVVVVERFAVSLGAVGDHSLLRVAEAKMRYNAQRADHKLENRVKEGGKAY